MSVVPLTYRQSTRGNNFFLVDYAEDGYLQVRGRGFVQTEDKVIYIPLLALTCDYINALLHVYVFSVDYRRHYV